MRNKHLYSCLAFMEGVLAFACGVITVFLLLKPATSETILPEIYILYCLCRWPGWSAMAKRFLLGLSGAFILIYAFIVVIDPFDTLEFSPKLPRYSVLNFLNERDNMYDDRLAISRYSKSPAFDSAIFGDSAVFMHQPVAYEKAFDSMDLHTVNLAMRASRPYEQSLVMHRFIHYHPAPKIMFFVMGANWCEPDPYMIIEPGSVPASLFPLWLVDSNPWNDYLHVFTYRYLHAAMQQFSYLTYHKKHAPLPSTYERNGSVREIDQKFFPDRALKDVRISLYGADGKREQAGKPVSKEEWDRIAKVTVYPRLALFDDVLKTLPDSTIKLAILQPEHWINQPKKGSDQDAKYSTCKVALAKVMGHYANTHIVDFRIDSPLTHDDTNFWDSIHYAYNVMARLPAWEAEAIKTGMSHKGVYDYIMPVRPAQ